MPLRVPVAVAAAVLLAALAVCPAGAADFTDAAGRHVVLPDDVWRILPAEPNAEVMIYALAPNKLVGTSRGRGRGGRGRGARLRWRPRGDPARMAATARRLHADLIIDAGTATPQRARFADQVTRQSGIPYILVDDSFDRLSRSMRGVGTIIGADYRHNRHLWRYAEHAIAALRGRLLIVPASARPRVYYALGRDGLTTALPGSPAAEAIAEAGAINVARPLGHGTDAAVRPAQLLAWNPEIIIAHSRRAYNAMRHNRRWRGLLAVRNHRVYLEPSYPFGWIGDPAGVNRLIGLYWLATLFYPETLQDDMRPTTCEFYDRFYRIRLTNARLERLLRSAGVPPAPPPLPIGEPLAGLGTAPPAPSPAPSPASPSGSAAGPLPEPFVNQTANAPCTLPGLPGSTKPLDLTAAPYTGTSGVGTSGNGTSGASHALSPPPLPGVPPPGRRGRPATLLYRRDAPPDAAATAGAGSDMAAPAGVAYQYQTRP